MKILVIGSGGREHALAWKLAQSEQVEAVLVAPGNAGTQLDEGTQNVDVAADDLDGLVSLAREREIDLTVVGPEAPLAAGVVDRFMQAGLKCFGPSADAARLESSKAFAKDFLSRHEIPTAAWIVVDNVDDGLEFARGRSLPLVLKADGLAAGKGVVVAEDERTVKKTLEDMLSGNAFGEAGHRVVIEQFLVGEEASFIALVDGETVLPLATSQDHKQRDEGDKGPNTGGMGAISPAPVVSDDLQDRIIDDIIRPTACGMVSDGHPFTGFLYAGLMITRTGARVLEFNVRLGDPETQPILVRLKSDLAEALMKTLHGKLDEVELEWDPRPAIGVVMAAGGYPDTYRKGDRITGLNLEWPDEIKVFHAGTRLENGNVLTDGGRVLCVTSLGDTLAQAKGEVYRWLPQIGFRDDYYRTDIGHHALARAGN
ncbi:MAG: phosphoribosylamine--glycine ligase [Wenzhouxiangellaceae bacterium]|nr:phosphoribosylamine--glycine ligase [Wenzhouxiangellaceae bacterium]MBS3746491.1 phosphoribosylamine--glycine ligase [Wenzhouxiangellaceae bacterium]MBS3823009.1 phosphoribosylamine--glycine ligase [Wenzhouxiangellaceae bacterium]